MHRLTLSLTMICGLSLTTGCATTPAQPVADTAANFCDIEAPRRFTQAEVDWRAVNAPENLRLDFKTNLAWDAECAS